MSPGECRASIGATADIRGRDPRSAIHFVGWRTRTLGVVSRGHGALSVGGTSAGNWSASGPTPDARSVDPEGMKWGDHRPGSNAQADAPPARKLTFSPDLFMG